MHILPIIRLLRSGGTTGQPTAGPAVGGWGCLNSKRKSGRWREERQDVNPPASRAGARCAGRSVRRRATHFLFLYPVELLAVCDENYSSRFWGNLPYSNTHDCETNF